MSGAYYNEIDPKAAAWLRELIRRNLIAPGDVDERSIEDVRPIEVRGYTQVHAFAGIGVWSYALRLAGWPDDRRVWTGSCPCQSFSAAGKGAGFADERHLWPAWHHLIRECRPDVVFGEQVEAAIPYGWTDLVQADLENDDYAVGFVGIPAAGVGAPHIRARLWFVADSTGKGRRSNRANSDACFGDETLRSGAQEPGRRSPVERLAIADVNGCDPSPVAGLHDAERNAQPCGGIGGMADAERERVWTREQGGAGSASSEVQGGIGERERIRPDAIAGNDHMGAWRSPLHGLWRDADWLACRDGKWRPVEARIQQMVDGYPLRVGPLCASLQSQVEEALNEAAFRLQAKADQVLREVREAAGAESLFLWGGGVRPVYEAQILLAYLLEHAREDGAEQDPADGSGEAGCPQRDMRMLWRGAQARDPSRQRKLAGQQHRQFADALRVLSSAVARFASEAGYPYLYEDAPASFPLGDPVHKGGAPHSLGSVQASNRVVRLRGYGNAINAEVAAAFIRAYLDVRAAA